MSKKNMTIEDLARMVQKDFNETATKMQLENVEKRLEQRIDNIEKIILKQHGTQIINLERRMNRLEDMFAVK